MWNRLKVHADRLEKGIEAWAKAPPSASGRFLSPCIDDGAEVHDVAAEIQMYNESTATKIAKVERYLAPIRRSFAVINGSIDSNNAPAPHLALMAYIAVEASVRATRAVFNRRDDSFSTVSTSTLKALIEPFWFVKPLVDQFGRATPQEWAAALRHVPGYEDTLKEQLVSGIAECIDAMVQVLILTSHVHPEGKQLSATCCAVLGPLSQACWSISRMIPTETGLAPKGVRKLLFNWSKSFNDIHGMARARGCSLPHDGSLAVPMAAHIIAAVATAQAEGDQNERDTVLKFIKTSALKIINAVFALKTGDVNDFNFPSAPDAVPQLLQAIGALRDVSTAPETPAEFSVYADRLALAACALAGLCLAAAAGPTRIDQLRVLCSSDFTECILMASQSWIHLLRCCRDAPGLEFWDIAGDVVHILGRFINAAVSITEHVTTASGHLRDMTSVSEADELSSVVAASPASVVRALAVLAAAMPEVLDLPDGTSVRTTNSVLLGRLMFGRLPDAAIGYSIMDDFYREDFKFASLETERAIHACLNTMLCLQVAPGPWRALRTDTELGAMAASSPQDAVPGFFAACTMLHWDLNALKNFSKSPKHAESDLGGEASVFAAIHGLAAAAGLSEAQMKDTASRFVHVGLLDTPLDLLRSVLVPVDADGLRKLLLCNDLVPGDSEALQALIKVAIDSEGLEERHKGRLQLLERLPEGVCANLRCSEPLTAVGKLRKCSGCLIVRYCCAKCSKIDWKHGHKVACQAVQRERSGGG